MSNIVVAGEYEGKTVQLLSKIEKDKWVNKQVFFPAIVLKVKFGSPEKWDHIKLNKENIVAYEVITDEHKQSTSSTIFRSLIGGAMFGLSSGLIRKSGYNPGGFSVIYDIMKDVNNKK